jgi:hypothetical protein
MPRNNVGVMGVCILRGLDLVDPDRGPPSLGGGDPVAS